MIPVGIAPVDMIPATNAVGNPEVVEPVPINPKLGRVSCARVVLFNAARATLVTAFMAVEAVNAEPATVPRDEIR